MPQPHPLKGFEAIVETLAGSRGTDQKKIHCRMILASFCIRS